jgi:hypothetical protein
MASQMVRFLSSMVGSMTSVIGANGVVEIVEVVQNHPTLVVPTSATTSPISAPRR